MAKFAHSLPDQPATRWEPLSHHLEAVGRTAAQFASAFGGDPMAQVMGQLHDIGKVSAAYQRYIHTGRDDGSATRGPDHSTAGAKEAITLFGDKLGRLLAYGIAGHHGGLMNFDDLDRRRHKPVEDYAGWQDHCGALPPMDVLRAASVSQSANCIDASFSKSFLGRMLFSCLVDADFLETERFYVRSAGKPEPTRGGTLTPSHLHAIRAYLAEIRRNDTELNRLRSKILDHANAKASLAPGLFTLTVPTGGGKTLTSLSFAAEHAVGYDLRRIIYVIPFTSIIEQTAEIFRKRVRLGDAVLEHHSSFDWDQKPPSDDSDEEHEGEDGSAKLRRDTENWDAPIVVTTAVQFFESVFASRPSRTRKLHNVAGSVIVLDEVQSLPIHLLRPCMAAIDEFAKNYGCSVVLCTATQPALRVQDAALAKQKEDDPHWGLDIPDTRELAPDPPKLYEKLKRVAVHWTRDEVSDEAIAARFEEKERMLCIVNSRAHARDLFLRLRNQGQDGAVHLSTLMCARHRREVLTEVRRDLEKERPVRLVSTSLIEAGVDIDFPEVWRAATGLSSVAQAAGRCNREGKLAGLGRTVVFEASQHKPPPALDAFYAAARPVLRKHKDDVLSLAAVTDFYAELYWKQGFEALDSARLADREPRGILPALRERSRTMEFPYASVSEAFRMINDAIVSVIIPYDIAARRAIDALRHAPLPPSGVQRTLQQYVVPVPPRTRDALLRDGAVSFIKPDEYGDRFAVLGDTKKGERPSSYDECLGLRIDTDPVARDSECNIFV
ncbi:MAG: CRISPR-associated endonuclease Cas3'' [Parvularcula sp.]|nr:CRISPR-associated endonuclease Cas3'' [Parvularcula sp.]